MNPAYTKQWGDRSATGDDGALILEGVALDSGPYPKDWPVEAGGFRGRIATRRPRCAPWLCEMSLPTPLLIGHDARRRVGEVFHASADADVLRFSASVPHPDRPDGHDPDDLREVWRSVRSGGCRAVSVGVGNIWQDVFMGPAEKIYLGNDCWEWRERAVEIPGRGSVPLDQFYRWTLRELSLVPAGAHPRARIESVMVPADVLEREAMIAKAGVMHDWCGGRARTAAPIATKAAPRAMTPGGFTPDTPTDDRIALLEARILELESRAVPDYKGGWDPEAQYRTNDWVSHGGSVWRAVSDNPQDRPGSRGTGWSLAVRHGRDT